MATPRSLGRKVERFFRDFYFVQQASGARELYWNAKAPPLFGRKFEINLDRHFHLALLSSFLWFRASTLQQSVKLRTYFSLLNHIN